MLKLQRKSAAKFKKFLATIYYNLYNYGNNSCGYMCFTIQFSDPTTSEIMFYRVKLNNYLVLMLAKAAESLIPTTMTFSLLLILTSEDNLGVVTTISILPVCGLGVLGLLQPTMNSVLGFWIILVLIYLLIIVSICTVSSLVNLQDTEYQNYHKSENPMVGLVDNK